MSSLIQSPAGEYVLHEPAAATTLVELLRLRAYEDAGHTAYTFLVDGEREEIALTYGELDRQARRIGAWLQSIGRAGERVLLLFPPGLEFIAAFFGCLYAGAVAVPAYPPRRNRNLLRLQSLVADAGAVAALTTETILSRITPQLSQDPLLGPLRWLAVDAIAEGAIGDWEAAWADPRVTPESLAFLQYTSGSTSSPKGVMVSHGNVLHNERLIQRAFRQTALSTIVGWLPVYHDMGLIGNVIQPLYVGAACVLMSPVAFLQSPLRWLQAITRYRATTSGGPNFAYDLCVRKVTEAQRETLDLSSWQVAFNGAEPIRLETLERFSETFRPCGFRRKAFLPCYGLAEATLLVSGSFRAASPRVERVQSEGLESHRVVEAALGDGDAIPLVGCGEVAAGEELIIVHPDSLRRCAPDQIGEIWIAGPSIARGYWNRPEETEQTFQARLSETGEGPFLRTGDLGFLKDGELFITGRLKDLIIIRGLNHYPQDIEQTVEKAHPALRPGGGAAFSVAEEESEQLVVVQEASARGQFEPEAIFASVNEALARVHELQAHAVVLIRPGSMPKTSSGKVQRHAARLAFLKGGLDVVAQWRAKRSAGPEVAPAIPRVARHTATEFEAWLRTLLAQKLSADEQTIATEQPISRYGLDSLGAIELMHEVEAETGVKVPFSLLLGDTSIAGLASYLFEHRGDAAGHQPAAPSSDQTAEHPLTYGQRALWFLYRMAPESAAYNLTNAARFVSPVDIEALHRSFQRLVERHPALRTTFSERDEQPVQQICEKAEVDFRVHDAMSLSDDAIRQLLNEEAHRPFDLEQGPLFRVRLYQRPAHEHVMQVSMHHIIADFWSMAVLMHELGVLYAAEVTGSPAKLATLSETYTDYARRQEEMLRGDEGERLYRFWHEQLSGELPVLNLPTDRPRPSVQTFDGASEFSRLDAGLTAQVKEYALRRGATLYTTLLAAFQMLLHRYTEETDIVIGSPTADRGRASVAGVVGYFVNPVVLRSDLSGDPTFEETLARARRTTLEAFEHQSYPFPLLVERLQPERDLARSPLFQTMFILQKSHLPGGASLAAFALGETGARLNLSGLNVEAVALDKQVAQFDLTVTFAETSDGLSGTWQYNTGVFDAATVSRMAGHFETLLRSSMSNPRQPVSTLQMLTPFESRRLLVEWNDTARDYPHGGSIHRLFEEQARRSPDMVALLSGDMRLTYRELDTRAELLARYLRARGVCRETLVGVYLHRSVEMLVALLGILKAGGAYVPLDPAYPTARLEFILDDTRAPLVLTQQSLMTTLPDGGACALCLDTQWEEIAAERRDVPAAESLPDNLAYVIYTSGSTGRPKGVAIAHRNAVTLLRWAGESFDAGQLRGVLAATSICFDLSVFELFAPLSWGGCVILAENALQLPLLKAKNEVTLVNTVPSVMAELLRMGGVPEGVRVVNLAGEALPARLVHEIHRQLAATDVINLYGPSEDTTYSTIARLGREDVGQPPIGRPIANTQAYVLGAHLGPVPVGVVGEVYLSGEGLARGYLNRPALTAERFIPHPHATEPGARLYQTGDLARYLPDGQLEYLARADHQVKVRGFRVELGEIEAALAEHPNVTQAVVMAREDLADDKRLVAYMTGHDGPSLTGSVLRSFIRERLPEYMVPSSFIVMEAMPLTPNGKVDRRALPAPSPAHHAPETRDARPLTATEEVLAQVWADLLRLEEVRADDNFFELGGHSLLAMQLLSRIRSIFRIELPLRVVFESPTVTGVARSIEAAMADGQSAPPSLLRRKGHDDDELPLSSAQQRLWFLDRMEPNSPFYNVPATVSLTGEVDVAALEAAINEVVRRHEVLRTTFPSVEGRAVQRIASALRLPLTRVELTHLSGQEQDEETRRLVTGEATRPFDLAHGPLMRVSLLRLGEREHVMLLTMHHIITDAWSLGLLMRELGALYTAFAAGRPSPLEELRIQYADFALWQQEWLRGDTLTKHLAYWKQQLEGAPAALELPTDRPRPPVQSYRGATQRFAVPEDSSRALKALSRREGVTPFMTLLAGFVTLLYRYTGQEDLVVGTPIANRTHGESEPLIGFFVNMLALRSTISGDLSFIDLLKQTRKVTLGAYAHQDIPFEKLVDELRPQRDLSRSPLFQVMFAMQNTPGGELELPGINLKLAPTDSGTSKFDLTLFMEESEHGFVGSWEYNTDLYEAETIARLSRHLLSLLSAAVESPERPLTSLPMLSETERHLLVEGYNDTRIFYPDASLPLHRLIERQVALTPDATALLFEDQALSYGELNSRANRLARHLRTLGVDHEVRVALLMERSVELVISLLAVLKAGAAYVPLDPEYPRERLAFMLEDSRAPILLTQAGRQAVITDYRGQVIVVDEVSNKLTSLPDSDLSDQECAAGPESLAYVIYTSGSTGKPKGAMNAHAGIVNRLVWMQHAFGLDSSDVVLQKTPFSFDVSVWEFFWPLMTGARLVLALPGGHRDAAYLCEVIAREAVTTLHFVPLMLGAWLNELGLAQACRSVRRVICSGEALGPELQERFWRALPGVELHNLYGPTEAGVDVTWWACRREWARRTVPIGHPIANTSIYVLDTRLEPVPEGVASELYLGGVQVGRGYLGRPALTAERFVPDPFDKEGGARLYRTGDVARWVTGGEVEYLGRTDHQVKVRGFRIELGEVETALCEHATVEESVCVVREERAGVKRLVAYVAGAGVAHASELVEHLRGRLPEYMVPQAFVRLDALPLTPNGKVDRRALPAPEYGVAAAGQEYVGARTAAEEVLCKIWQRALGVEWVGIHDNFFELGGDSILSVQIISHAAQAGLHFTLRQLFQNQTVAELAAAASTSDATEAEQGTVVGVVPLTPVQRWFFESEPVDPHHFNQALLLEVKGALDAALLRRAVEYLYVHHDALRLRFERGPEGWQQFNAESAPQSAFHVADISGLDEVAQSDAIADVAARAQGSFDLSEGPLLKLVLFDLGAGRAGRLLLVAHHLVVDGVSWRILLDDLQTAYRQLSRGEKVNPGPKTCSFKQWAEGLVEYARSGEIKADYWLNAFTSSVEPLPVDCRGENTVASTGHVSVELDAEETRALIQQVPAAYRTQIDEVLLAALAQSFKQWGVRHLLVDVEGHGRDGQIVDLNLSRTVGWFTAIYPLLFETGAGAWPDGVLKNVKEQVRAVPQRGVGYGLLRYLGGEEIAAQLRAMPSAEVSFNYLGQLDQVLASSDMFGVAREAVGLSQSLRERRRYLIEVNGSVLGGCFRTIWTYSENVHRRATVERLAETFTQALRDLITHGRSGDAEAITPSDFPLAKLDKNKLTKLTALINKRG